MQRFNIRWLALLAICLIALYLCWLITLPFLDVIIWSVVLAIVFYPLYERCRRWVASPKWAAAALTVLILILGALLPIAILAVSAASQVDEGVAMAQDGINKGKQFLAGDSRLAHYIHQYVDTDQIGDQLKGVAGPAIQNSLKIAGGVLGVLVKVAFTMFALFYLLRDADAVGRVTMSLLPLTEEQSLRVFHRCREVIKASVQGVMVIAAVQGVIGGISFAAVGIPSSILWGFVMFIAALVPAVGAAIVWLPAAAILALQHHYWKAGIIVFVGGVIVSSIDNVLRPRLVGEKAGLHDLVIFFSVLGGLQAFGVAGLFIGPVVVALTLAIIEVFKQMNPVGAAKPVESKVIVGSDGTALATPQSGVVPTDAASPALIVSPAGQSAAS